MKAKVLVLACGALAHELVALQRRNQWDQVRFQCLPAELHNRPERIPGAVRAALEEYQPEFDHVFVAYADCGTGGLLDKVLQEYGVERIPGAHCYEFYSGTEAFTALADEEPGTFYLTDFLVTHFDRLVRRGLGLDRHPELRDQYFGNYRRLVYLAQQEAPELSHQARRHADWLGLDYHEQRTGLGPLHLAIKDTAGQWQN